MAGFPLEVQRGLRLALDAERQGLLSPERLDAILRYYDQEGGIYPAPAPEVLEKLGGLSAAQVAHLLGLRPPGFQPRELTPRLLLLEPLGEGGMGTVYKAQDRVLRRVVAVKLIKGERLGSSQALQRFEREALVMARVAHPACVPVYEAGVAEDQPYLVMKLIPGRSLKDVLIEHPLGVDPRRVARWGQRLAEGLQACHEAGVIHRDVKPANVLLDEQDQPLLTDFGVALDGEARTRLTLASGAVGTLAYMPPEQAGGEIADPRSDLYALGATLYEALTGRLPLEADQPLVLVRKITEERPRPLREHRPDLPADLERVVLTCLEKARADRYPSAPALALDLARFLAGEPVSARPVGVVGRTWRWCARHRWTLSRVGLVLGVLAIGLVLATAKARSTARRTASLEIDAAVAAHSLHSEERLVQLTGSEDPWIADKSASALRLVRVRTQLSVASDGLRRLEEVKSRKDQIERGLAGVDRDIDESVPVSQSPAKQERLRLRSELATLPARRAEAVSDINRALDRAASLGSEQREVNALRAQLLERLAREADIDQAEGLFLQALQADRAGGDRLGPALAPACVQVTGEFPCPLVLYCYRYDPGSGVKWPHMFRNQLSPCVFDLPCGEYLLESRLPGYLPFRETLVLRRGERRGLSLRLTSVRTLGPLSEEATWVPGGRVQVAGKTWGVVAGFGIGRTEVSMEAWRSLWYHQNRHPALVPLGLLDGVGEEQLADPGMDRLPINRVSQQDSLLFCSHLELELALAQVPLWVGLAIPQEFHRALRGEFTWRFPWGDHFDPGLCACAASVQGLAQPVGHPATDCSPFSVAGLAGNVAEWGAACSSSQAYQMGASGASSAHSLETRMEGFEAFPARNEAPDVGLRYVLRPALWPREVPHPDPSVNWIQVALRAMAAKDVGPALQAARNHVAVKPREAWRWVDRARVQLQVGDTWGAWFSATQATLLKPEWGEAWHVLGQVQSMRGNDEEALRACNRCVELDPSYRLAFYSRSIVRSRLGDYVGGVADATHFLCRCEQELSPYHPDIQLGCQVVLGIMQRLAREVAVKALSR